ncbi:MAG: helix-turn-helix domain-containing protein [Eubacterium sp.]|nr:helix-turn-helix domain-containing protein [Eubacterium sp.]
MDNYEFAKRIYELRSEKGISQKELGDMLSVSNKAVSKWENGESMPKTTTLIKLAEIFDLDINELMGAPAKNEDAVTDELKINEAELTQLKAENAALRSRIVKTDKKKKFNTIIAILLCALAVCGAGFFAFFADSAPQADNKSVADAGKDGTKIVFSGKTFIPATKMDKELYGNYGFDDTKYANYFDKSGKQTKVLVKCSSYSRFVGLSVGKKTYLYSQKDSRTDITIANISDLHLEYGKSVAHAKGADYRPDYERGIRLFNITDRYYSDYDSESMKLITAFCDFYSSKKPVDEKDRITEFYLGNDAIKVSVKFKDAGKNRVFEEELELGEFFFDKEMNMYFYDYTTAKSYKVGEELKKLVYIENQ